MVYTASSLSLAALELLANLKRRKAPDDLVATPADIPPGVGITEIEISRLPANWRDYPVPDVLRDLGARWAHELKTAVLAVPSALVPSELNYLLNPRHPDFRKIRVGRPEPFSFDPRLSSARRELVEPTRS